MRIHFIGTGSGFPDPFRKPSSMLLEHDGRFLLIDTGEGVAQYLVENSVYQEVEVAIISHPHADHICGLGMLLLGWKHRRETPFILYAPEQLATLLPEWLSTIRLHPEQMEFPMEIRSLQQHPISASPPIPAFPGLELVAIPNDHLPPDAGNSPQSYSFLVKDEKTRWVISSDLGSLDPIRPYLNDASGLIIEASHISVADSIEAAKTAGIEQVIVTHIPSDSPSFSDESCIPAHDGMIIDTSAMSTVNREERNR